MSSVIRRGNIAKWVIESQGSPGIKSWQFPISFSVFTGRPLEYKEICTEINYTETRQVCMGKKMHKSILLIFIINHFHRKSRCIKTWKKNRWDKHSGPNTAITTQDFQQDKQQLDCTHTLFFLFLLLLPRPRELRVTKNLILDKENTHPESGVVRQQKRQKRTSFYTQRPRTGTYLLWFCCCLISDYHKIIDHFLVIMH